MQTHTSSCLAGPSSKTRTWWQMVNADQYPELPKGDSTADRPRDEDDGFRADLVARVRREIAAGTYDTEEKWELALDNLLQRLEETA